ncbi:unnamed protein product [Paramecium pentaurelia]|uniref:Transmembrane protein n=1 Tax=Paramecium pentaurelia TaxID=43138 RepID=A0A8S1YCX1_9CILI|nr:unnamed protein product [Paramecium pentaurelia]
MPISQQEQSNLIYMVQIYKDGRLRELEVGVFLNKLLQWLINFLYSVTYGKQEVFKNPMQEDGLINFTQEDIQYLSLVHLFLKQLMPLYICLRPLLIVRRYKLQTLELKNKKEHKNSQNYIKQTDEEDQLQKILNCYYYYIIMLRSIYQDSLQLYLIIFNFKLQQPLNRYHIFFTLIISITFSAQIFKSSDAI